MFSFRVKTGKNAVPKHGDGVLADVKALGRTIGSAVPNGEPSEFDGDGDGFRTGPSGEDNVPVSPTKPVDALRGAWDKLREKKISGDEARAIKAAQKMKGKKPRYTPSEMGKLLRGARTRQDAADARKMAREWCESIFALEGLGDNGNYRVKLFNGETGVNIVGRKREVLAVHNEDEPYLHIRISGQLIDENGRSAGVFERRIYLDDYNAAKKPHVYNEVLRIDPERRGEGIGADFTLASEAQYAAMGLDEMRLNAGLTDGVYTWLRAGYRFKNDEERVDFVQNLEKRYQQMLKDAGSKENLVKGGFETAVGRWFSDDDGKLKMPEPMFESMEQLELFLKFMGRAKSSPQGSDREIPPAVFTMFGQFSRQIMRGLNNDMVKEINPRFSPEQKSLVISGLDILTTRVYD